MPTLTTVAQVRALVKTGLSDADLQAVIDREEALLADDVGVLSGSRVETFVIDEASASLPVRLRRPTTSIAVTEANTTTTNVRLGSTGRTVTRLTSSGWGQAAWLGVVEVTYTPNDTARIVSWVIELVRARLAETGFESETASEYSYSRGGRSYEATMTEAVGDILGRRSGGRGIRSVVMSTAGPTGWVGGVRP